MSDGREEMSSLGIMTLTRTPCELDRMSLFQDLKLKRRKVDSRCSSDGESVADTSTSSPDLVGPSSPKMADINPPSPDSTPGTQMQQLQVTTTTCSASTQDCSVFDGGGGGGGGGGGRQGGAGGCEVGGSGGATSVIILRSQSPPVRLATSSSPPQPPRPHSSPGVPPTTTVSTLRQSPLVISPPPPPTSSHSQEVHRTLQTQSVVTQSSSASPSPQCVIGVMASQQAAVIQNQLWLHNSRINGVKPELIGGNFGNAGLLSHVADVKPLTLGAGSHRLVTSSVRQTPTVIMGEAGGVRTMIWSQPSLNVAQCPKMEPQLQPSTSNWSSNSSSSSSSASVLPNSEESAAQVLLNLGQERPRPVTVSRTSTIRSPTHFGSVPLNMERLWAGDLTQLPTNQQMQALNLTSPPPMMYINPRLDIKPLDPGVSGVEVAEEEEQPMICMICEDKATGLHYGIITCEGCKGFFKRTVQNRRVYTCVADGNCEITKTQRNRCQYCRFKKCIEQGMVLQAVREDRMPGGRNSGAVYNLYKVKYKKHKKSSSAKQQQGQKPTEKMMLSHQIKSEQPASIPSHLVNGTILKTALTNPSEVVHLRQRLDSAVSSSRDRSFSIEYTLSMIQTLIDCDEFQDIATLQNLDDLLDHKSDLSEKLCQIGDSIVYKLVQWTKRLPFYLELPVEVHTRLLTHKWHELLVLTTSAYQAIHGASKIESDQSTFNTPEPDFTMEVDTNLCTLQNCLTSMMGRPITMDQLRQDVGLMVEKITHVTLMFRRIKLNMEEYVCLKVITMLNQAKSGVSVSSSELESIQERYMTCLRAYTQSTYPDQPNRFQELLVRLPEVQSAAALLLESKMFYVPFLLNSAIER